MWGKYTNGEVSRVSNFLLHAFQVIHVFVLGFGEIMMTMSGIFSAVDISSARYFSLDKLPQVRSGLRVALEG